MRFVPDNPSPTDTRPLGFPTTYVASAREAAELAAGWSREHAARVAREAEEREPVTSEETTCK